MTNMKHASEYDALEASSKAMRYGLRRERLLLKVTQELCESLADTGITQADLARELGKSESFVSQILGGGRNLTLRTIADVATALGRDVQVSLRRASPCRTLLTFPASWVPKKPSFVVEDQKDVELEQGAA